jgi:hypothetical protein
VELTLSPFLPFEGAEELTLSPFLRFEGAEELMLSPLLLFGGSGALPARHSAQSRRNGKAFIWTGDPVLVSRP